MIKNFNLALKTGIIFAVFWCILLIIAFLNYPKPDNLIVGYIPLILFGLDALGSMTMLEAISICALQTIIIFLLGYSIGRYIQNKRNTKAND